MYKIFFCFELVIEMLYALPVGLSRNTVGLFGVSARVAPVGGAPRDM